jgi:hypothetical protein
MRFRRQVLRSLRILRRPSTLEILKILKDKFALESLHISLWGFRTDQGWV